VSTAGARSVALRGTLRRALVLRRRPARRRDGPRDGGLHPEDDRVQVRPGERWTEEPDASDSHDVDLIDDDELLVANARTYNRTAGVNEVRVFVYNGTTDEVTRAWSSGDRSASRVRHARSSM
jgi:hypothetical protein